MWNSFPKSHYDPVVLRLLIDAWQVGVCVVFGDGYLGPAVLPLSHGLTSAVLCESINASSGLTFWRLDLCSHESALPCV